MVEDYDALAHRLQRIRLRGIKLSVDDMGTGYSGLSHILKLLPDTVKFDLAITSHIDNDPVKQALAVALIQFAKTIQATVIAEGIESPQEAQILKDLGITLGQGFFLGHPGSVQLLTSMV
jgi:EAL domain-containing protein (putative c-di-GMP-specific phosphodiesterase class I)